MTKVGDKMVVGEHVSGGAIPEEDDLILMCVGSSITSSGCVSTEIVIFEAGDVAERNLGSRAEASSDGNPPQVAHAVVAAMTLAEDFGSPAPPRYHIGIEISWIYDAAGFRISGITVRNDTPTIIRVLAVNFNSTLERETVIGSRDRAYRNESLSIPTNFMVSNLFETIIEIKLVSRIGVPDYPSKTIVIPKGSTDPEDWNIIPSVFGE